MKHNFLRTIKQALPPRWLLFVFAFLYTVCLVAENSIRFENTSWSELSPINDGTGRAFVTILFCIIYGMYRVLAFHPLCRTNYLSWLKTTPWTHRQRLPYGPIHLQWADLIVPTILGFIEWLVPGLNPAWIPLTVLLSYLVVLAFAFIKSEARAWSVILFTGLSFVPVFWYSPLVMLSITLALLFASYFGISHSLSKFPWDHEKLERYPYSKTQGSPLCVYREKRPLDILRVVGWPFVHITHPGPDRSLSRQHKVIVVSIGLACWSFVVISIAQVEQWNRLADSIFANFLFFLMLVRLGELSRFGGQPISKLGRVFTGNLIIPRYDSFLLAPLSTILIGMTVYAASAILNIPLIIRMPVLLSVTTYVSMITPPLPANWRLTGGFHIKSRNLRQNRKNMKHSKNNKQSAV